MRFECSSAGAVFRFSFCAAFSRSSASGSLVPPLSLFTLHADLVSLAAIRFFASGLFLSRRIVSALRRVPCRRLVSARPTQKQATGAVFPASRRSPLLSQNCRWSFAGSSSRLREPLDESRRDSYAPATPMLRVDGSPSTRRRRCGKSTGLLRPGDADVENRRGSFAPATPMQKVDGASSPRRCRCRKSTGPFCPGDADELRNTRDCFNSRLVLSKLIAR